MTLARRVHLLLLAVAPALCLPRGVELKWCLCRPVQSSCCGDCCGAPDEPGYTSPSDRAGCPGCHRVDVVDSFDQLASVATAELPEAAPSLGTATSWGHLAEPPAPRAAAGRAPPPRVTPTGLLPGVAPLRL